MGELMMGQSHGFDCSTPGDNQLIPARMNYPIQVCKIALTSWDAVDVYFKTQTNTLSGVFHFTAGGGLVLDGPEGFHLFTTGPGEAFIMNLSAGVRVTGTIWGAYG